MFKLLQLWNVYFSFAEPVKKRSKLVLPTPQISEEELEEVCDVLLLEISNT